MEAVRQRPAAEERVEGALDGEERGELAGLRVDRADEDVDELEQRPQQEELGGRHAPGVEAGLQLEEGDLRREHADGVVERADVLRREAPRLQRRLPRLLRVEPVEERLREGAQPAGEGPRAEADRQVDERAGRGGAAGLQEVDGVVRARRERQDAAGDGAARRADELVPDGERVDVLRRVLLEPALEDEHLAAALVVDRVAARREVHRAVRRADDALEVVRGALAPLARVRRVLVGVQLVQRAAEGGVDDEPEGPRGPGALLAHRAGQRGARELELGLEGLWRGRRRPREARGRELGLEGLYAAVRDGGEPAGCEDAHALRLERGDVDALGVEGVRVEVAVDLVLVQGAEELVDLPEEGAREGRRRERVQRLDEGRRVEAVRLDRHVVVLDDVDQPEVVEALVLLREVRARLQSLQGPAEARVRAQPADEEVERDAQRLLALDLLPCEPRDFRHRVVDLEPAVQREEGRREGALRRGRREQFDA